MFFLYLKGFLLDQNEHINPLAEGPGVCREKKIEKKILKKNI